MHTADLMPFKIYFSAFHGGFNISSLTYSDSTKVCMMKVQHSVNDNSDKLRQIMLSVYHTNHERTAVTVYSLQTKRNDHLQLQTKRNNLFDVVYKLREKKRFQYATIETTSSVGCMYG